MSQLKFARGGVLFRSLANRLYFSSLYITYIWNDINPSYLHHSHLCKPYPDGVACQAALIFVTLEVLPGSVHNFFSFYTFGTLKDQFLYQNKLLGGPGSLSPREIKQRNNILLELDRV